MSTKPITAEESRIVREAGLKPFMMKSNGARVFDINEIEAVRAQKELQVARAHAEYFTSSEFRNDVMAELMDNGATLEQATNRTRDQARLFAEARALNLM